GAVSIVHQPVRMDGTFAVGETSSIRAGRDILLMHIAAVQPGPIDVAGPGEFLMIAGRNIDLGQGTGLEGELGESGIVSSGNTSNSLLPKQGANITLLAGLRADGADYSQATSMGFAALGANGLTDHAGDLYALLAAGGGSVVPLGTPQAQAFTALATTQQ